MITRKCSDYSCIATCSPALSSNSLELAHTLSPAHLLTLSCTRQNSLTHSSACLCSPEVLYTHFGPKIPPPRDFEDGGPICTKLQDMIALSSAQNKYVSAFRKIVPFWNGHRPIGCRVDKTAQND